MISAQKTKESLSGILLCMKDKGWVGKCCYTKEMTEIIDGLSRLGFNTNAAKVYLFLLRRGTSKATPIIEETKLHRMTVYNALDELADQGFVTIVYQDKVKLFKAEDPILLLQRVKKLEVVASNLVEELKKAQSEVENSVSVRTLNGEKGFRTNLEDIIEIASKQKDKTISIIGGAKDTDFYDVIGDWYETYISLLNKHKIHKKLLAPASFSEEFKKRFVAESRTELKVLKNGLSSPSYTRITEGLVSVELYRPEITIIQIRSKSVAKSYLESFCLLWENN